MGSSRASVPGVAGAVSVADRARFLEQGYLVVKQVVSPGDLERTRAAYERLVDIQRDLWAAEAGPDDPPGGVWDTEPQPRLNLTTEPLASRIPGEAAPAVDLWLGRAHEVSSALLGLDDAAVTEMMLMCNSRRDHGPLGIPHQPPGRVTGTMLRYPQKTLKSLFLFCLPTAASSGSVAAFSTRRPVQITGSVVVLDFPGLHVKAR